MNRNVVVSYQKIKNQTKRKSILLLQSSNFFLYSIFNLMLLFTNEVVNLFDA